MYLTELEHEAFLRGRAAGLIPAGAEEPEDVPPPPPPLKSEKERRTSFAIWRAFSSLPEKERREMVKLQRTDPEKFRKVMTEKGEALLKADRDRLIELRSMVAEYISTADSDRREELYKKIEGATWGRCKAFCKSSWTRSPEKYASPSNF